MYHRLETNKHLILEPKKEANACVIWLHGLGANGYDFEPVVELLRLDPKVAIRFVFPHAKKIPVTLNDKRLMPAWYDVYDLEGKKGEDEKGIDQAGRALSRWIDKQVTAGISANRIILAGFSQGGAVVLQAGLRYPKRLAGLVVLSSYLPLASMVLEEHHPESLRTPLIMVHGKQDNVINLAIAEASLGTLRAFGYKIDWHLYPGLGHEISLEVIHKISQWINQVLLVSLD